MTVNIQDVTCNLSKKKFKHPKYSKNSEHYCVKRSQSPEHHHLETNQVSKSLYPIVVYISWGTNSKIFTQYNYPQLISSAA